MIGFAAELRGVTLEKLDESAPARSTTYLPWLVVLVGTLVYLNSLSGAFLLDDERSILENQRIHQVWPVGDLLAHSRRPLVNLSFAINYAISGVEEWSYHAFNLLIHLLAGLVLFGVVRRTLLGAFYRQSHERSAPWVASAAQADDLADRIRGRLDLYRQAKPYRQSAGGRGAIRP